MLKPRFALAVCLAVSGLAAQIIGNSPEPKNQWHSHR